MFPAKSYLLAFTHKIAPADKRDLAYKSCTIFSLQHQSPSYLPLEQKLESTSTYIALGLKQSFDLASLFPLVCRELRCPPAGSKSGKTPEVIPIYHRPRRFSIASCPEGGSTRNAPRSRIQKTILPCSRLALMDQQCAYSDEIVSKNIKGRFGSGAR